MANVEVSEVTTVQIPALGQLMDSYRVFYGQESNQQQSLLYIERMFAQKAASFLVAKDEFKTLVGFCTLFPSFSSVHAKSILILNDLYVDTAYRRKGFAAALMQAAESFAIAQGVTVLTLKTAEDNHQAQQLYMAQGWKKSQFLSYDKVLKP